MKRCDHSHWLSFGTYGNETSLLESDRLQTLTHHLQDPDTQQPSLFVLIGNTSKSLALRELFGTKKARKFTSKQHTGEIHLHLDPSSIFHSRPILIADGDLPQQTLTVKVLSSEKCHETMRRTLPNSTADSRIALDGTTDSIYSHLLLPFTDVFCFFSADLGGFRRIARHLAVWLEKGQSSTLPRSTNPRVIIVTEKIPLGVHEEKKARKAFLWLLREETTHELSKQISDIHVVALLPGHKVSSEARFRRLKECLLNRSDEVRRNKEIARTLFSATHFAALFGYACDHFSQTSEALFDPIRASRKQNPVAEDLAKHLSIFLKHIKSAEELTEFAVPVIASSILLDNYPPDTHMFEPEDVFQALYKEAFYQVSESRVIAFEESRDVILRSGFISKFESQLRVFFEQSIRSGGTPSSEIHRDNLRVFEDRWRNIKSSTTCFTCLRRRPQYKLRCGHIVCENCVLVFGERCVDDPWIFKVKCCFLCGFEMLEDVIVKENPPTSGVAVLCVDGGGTRAIVALENLKKVQDCVGLQIPIQKFFKVFVGTSSGGLIGGGLYINGWTVEETIPMFMKLAKRSFRGRKTLGVPFLSWIVQLLVAYSCDGLYPASHIEAALKEAYGNGSILDSSYATSIGAKVGLTVATVGDPTLCMFTNYNGVGARDPGLGYHMIKQEDAHGRIPFWEIARCASAAPGFFPPKKIDGVGTFQDAGPLENDPLITALSETAVMFPLVEEPDFIVSLGTGTPREKGGSVSVSGPLGLWKYRAFPRLWRMFWERMRDRHVKRIFRTHPRYHRLDTELDGALPRLDNTKSIHELQLKAREDSSMTKVIENIARCAVASLFYFELDSIPERRNGQHIGTGSIFSSVRRSDPAFKLLLNKLLRATFYLNDSPLPGEVGDCSFIGKDGNFRKRVELSLSGKFTISLKQDDSEPCNISGSPYQIEKLISAQGLDAHFGRAHHGKRKRSADGDLSTRKRQRITSCSI